MIYLDNAATTPVRREALEAMWPYLTQEFGNPSSQNAPGERARAALTDARTRVAAVLGCRPGEIIFTSGGTEADNLALKGIALAAPRGRHLVTTPIEHEAVLACCDYLKRHHGFTITELPVDSFGQVDPEDLRSALRDDTTLCSIMLANNEVGTIQPVAALSALARERRVPFHTDAVQAAGVLPISLPALGVDALSLSGHKVGAPKGIGVLAIRSRLTLEPVLHGGGQERGRRSGTENVAGAVAFAIALELTERERPGKAEHLIVMRDALIRGVLAEVPGAMLTGHPTERLPGNASFCFPQTSGESVLIQLEERGIIGSSGSACAAGRNDPSHVLLAMGIAPEVAGTAVRFSLPVGLTPDEVKDIVNSVRKATEALRGIGTER